MAVVRDEEYAVVVERERPLLQACAYLLTADVKRADRLVRDGLAGRRVAELGLAGQLSGGVDLQLVHVRSSLRGPLRAAGPPWR